MEKTLTVIGLLVAMLGCQKEPSIGPISEQSDETLSIVGHRLIIGCEGNFQYDNASITAYGIGSQEVAQQVYKAANDRPIGDILQSIVHRGGLIYVVMNNSGVVRILSDSTYVEVGTIENLSSPRYLHFVDDHTLLVSDLSSSAVTVIHPETQQHIGSIETGQWTEMMGTSDGITYVAGMKDSVLLGLDLVSLSVGFSIDLPMSPDRMLSKNDSLLVIGNAKKGAKMTWIRKNGDMEYVGLDHPVNGAALFGKFIYILSAERINVYDLMLHKVGGWRHEAITPYALFVDSSGIYIADVKDYISSGEVLYYGHHQNLMDRIPCGYIPQAMLSL
ncbi:MAG: hypothetical protein RLP15_14190 [Cryomorphaceae bacterium]